jgi:site-specific DNA-methyltransferase (adenine-specific)
MSEEEFKELIINAFYCADKYMKEGACFYIWYADVKTFEFFQAVKKIKWKISQNLIWEKNTLVLGRKDYHFKHEPCIYGWKEGAAHNWYNGRNETTILNFNKPSKNRLHPTMKPLDLIGYLIKNSSKTNDSVLDLFGGSGSTLMACEQLDRNCYMMELDPHYVDVIIQRWEKFTGCKAELIE